jgi:GTPase SAR1 family protein
MESTIYFTGTAGAGKSTMLAAFDRWCKQHGLTTLTVNLDPGAEALQYEPDIDIRDRIKLSEIMEEHGLGPNGAQIAAADMIALNLEELQEEIGTYRADLTLIDTPGQVELFVFRQSGKHIVENLAPGSSVICYLLDPFLARTAVGFASQLMLGATTFFRFQEPLVPVLSKADMIDDESRETILAWAADADALEQDIIKEEPGMDRELALQVTRMLDSIGHDQHLFAVSSLDNMGFDDLYAQVQAVIGQSEESTPEYDTFLGQGQEESGDPLSDPSET